MASRKVDSKTLTIRRDPSHPPLYASVQHPSDSAHLHLLDRIRPCVKRFTDHLTRCTPQSITRAIRRTSISLSKSTRRVSFQRVGRVERESQLQHDWPAQFSRPISSRDYQCTGPSSPPHQRPSSRLIDSISASRSSGRFINTMSLLSKPWCFRSVC